MNEQPNTTNKLLVGGGAGAVVVIVAWLVKTFAHVELPVEVGMALSTVITLFAAHFTPVGKDQNQL